MNDYKKLLRDRDEWWSMVQNAEADYNEDISPIIKKSRLDMLRNLQVSYLHAAYLVEHYENHREGV